MSLTLPIYKRGNTFVLHIRIAGRQIKRSLATNDAALAKLRAMQLLGQITTDRLGQVADKQKFSAPPIKLEALRDLRIQRRRAEEPSVYCCCSTCFSFRQHLGVGETAFDPKRSIEPTKSQQKTSANTHAINDGARGERLAHGRGCA